MFFKKNIKIGNRLYIYYIAIFLILAVIIFFVSKLNLDIQKTQPNLDISYNVKLSEFPNDFPVFLINQDDQILNSFIVGEGGNKKQYGVRFITKNSPNQAFDFYIKNLLKNGWGLINNNNPVYFEKNQTYNFSFLKSNNELKIFISQNNAGQVIVDITLIKY
jgi:hypothetical protein